MPAKVRPPKTLQSEKVENYDSDKGKENPETQLTELEITNLHEKDFRLMIVKVIEDLGNKPEAKIDKLQEILSKEIEDLKIKQIEMQNTITKIKKKSLEGTKSRMQDAEE